MDTSTLPDLTSLLQSGGNVAAMVAVYVGLKVLEAVKKFLNRVAATIEETTLTNKRVIALLEKMETRTP
jgi:hypothetical protein